MEPVSGDDCTEASDSAGCGCQSGQLQGVIIEMGNGDQERLFIGAIQGRVR